MSRWSIACTALALVGLLGVGPTRAAEAVFPLGSHFGLAPPGDMKPAVAFRGFEDRDTDASMLIVEIPPQNAAEVEKELAAATLKKQGLSEDTRETIPLKAGKGLLIVGDQQADSKKLRKWIFLASAPERTALIAVQVPEAAKSKYSDADMRAALLSTIVRASVPMGEQLRLVPFAFDELSGLRPFRVLGTTTVFLTDGATDPQDAAAQPLLIVSIAPGGPEQASDRANFSRRLFGSLNDFKDVRIVGNDVLRLNNMPTYEIQAEAKDPKSDAPMKLVQWIRFGNGAYLRFVGMSRSESWREAFPKFRAVRDGVKPRG